MEFLCGFVKFFPQEQFSDCVGYVFNILNLDFNIENFNVYIFGFADITRIRLLHNYHCYIFDNESLNL